MKIKTLNPADMGTGGMKTGRKPSRPGVRDGAGIGAGNVRLITEATAQLTGISTEILRSRSNKTQNKTVDEARKALMLVLREAGASSQETSDEMGIKRNTVKQRWVLLNDQLHEGCDWEELYHKLRGRAGEIDGVEIQTIEAMAEAPKVKPVARHIEPGLCIGRVSVRRGYGYPGMRDEKCLSCAHFMRYKGGLEPDLPMLMPERHAKTCSQREAI